MATRGWERDDDYATRRIGDGSVAHDSQQDAGVPPSAQGDGGASADAGANTNAANVEPVAVKKRRVLKESHLVSREGLKKIKRTFPYQVSGDVAGREAQALASLIKMYKQWAFDLYPGLNFEDFIERAEMLGKTHQVQGLMSDLRNKEMLRAQRAQRNDEGEEEEGDGVPREPEEHHDDDLDDDVVGEEAML